ncbi:MAG TPA: hypothetical protein VGB37_16495 [Candidatus Lokiarchaeia archaeon]
MVWYSLKIGNWSIRYTPLNPIIKEYPSCNKDGKLLKKVAGRFESGYFIDEKGNKYDTAFKLINGKPYAKLQKTKETSNYKEVDINEVEDLLQERVYLAECNELLNELTNSEKSLKFGFTNGNGFKVYKAYIYPSKIYKGYLFMSLGTTQISEIIKEINEVKKEKKKLAEIDISLQGINRAKIEELITI